MKKLLFFAAAASVALVACTKNEVAQIDNEITYQTVQTRGASAFSTSNHFISYAYFLPQGSNWDADFGDAELYISAADIYCHKDSQPYMWKAENTYYWPKQGSLTFFAWSTNTNTTPSINAVPPIPNNVTCSAATGISVASYDLTKNKNVDFLVAEVAKNETARTDKDQFDGWQAGVPTVFKHALSSIAFNVQKAQDYSNVSFTVKSIKLLGVCNKASYAQTWNAVSPQHEHEWTSQTTGTIPAFTGTQEVTSTSPVDLTITDPDYSIVFPQDFSSEQIQIVYDIKTSFTGTPVIEENVTETKNLNEIFTNGWKPGKKYTVTIKLSLDEILWAPNVTEWEVGTATDINI